MAQNAHTCWSCQSLGNPHAGFLRCIHGFCTHARYGDVVRPPVECYICIINWLQNDPVQPQEHTVYNDQISSDEQSRDAHSLPDSQISTYVRGRLKDLVQGAIPDLALGSGEWFLRDNEHTFRIRISYGPSAAESVFRDFKSGSGRVTALSQPAMPLYEFLEQFYNVKKRWVKYYPDVTRYFLAQSAMFQEKLLSKANENESADVSDKSILIALSLRCLVLTHEIVYVKGSLTYNVKETHYQAKKYCPEDPDIEVSRLSSTAAQASLANTKQQTSPDSLSSILEGILQTTQQLMFRRNPEHWPILLCTLCLMRLTVENFSIIRPWMRSLEPAYQALGKAFSILCRLFEFCAKDFNPFSDMWNLEEYAVAVKDDRVLIGYAEKLQTMWLDEVYAYNDLFSTNLEDCDLETRITAFTGGFEVPISA